jgi:predicted nucleic acid-binding protein
VSASQTSVFADTAYWIAIVDRHQSLHQRAVDVSRTINLTPIITSDAVLIEFLNFFCERGEYWRTTAIRLVDTLLANSQVVVEPQTRDVFTGGLALYRQRSDKGYSMTDCMSMVVMKRRNVRTVLTSDHHFEQEAFTILLG